MNNNPNYLISSEPPKKITIKKPTRKKLFSKRASLRQITDYFERQEIAKEIFPNINKKEVVNQNIPPPPKILYRSQSMRMLSEKGGVPYKGEEITFQSQTRLSQKLGNIRNLHNIKNAARTPRVARAKPQPIITYTPRNVLRKNSSNEKVNQEINFRYQTTDNYGFADVKAKLDEEEEEEEKYEGEEFAPIIERAPLPKKGKGKSQTFRNDYTMGYVKQKEELAKLRELNHECPGTKLDDMIQNLIDVDDAAENQFRQIDEESIKSYIGKKNKKANLPYIVKVLWDKDKETQDETQGKFGSLYLSSQRALIKHRGSQMQTHHIELRRYIKGMDSTLTLKKSLSAMALEK